MPTPKREFASLDQLVTAIEELEAKGAIMNAQYPAIILPLTAAILHLTKEVKALRSEVDRLKSQSVVG